MILGLYGGDTSAVATTIGWELLFTALWAVLGLGDLHGAPQQHWGDRWPARLELRRQKSGSALARRRDRRVPPSSPEQASKGAGAESSDSDGQRACRVPGEGGQFRLRRVRGDLFAYSDGS